MSGTGNCYDNAVVENFFGTLKMERVHDVRYQLYKSANLAVSRISVFKILSATHLKGET
jgi:transposase InsO family protein